MFPYFRISESIYISTYALFVALAAIVASLWFVRRSEELNLKRMVAIDMALVGLAGGFAGARLLHVLYEEPSYYLEKPLAIFAVWNGGFVFYGGLLGTLIAGYWFCQVRRQPFWLWADAAALPAALGYAIGRIGCLFNGCCYGKVCSLPWALTIHDMSRHPTQLYAAFWELTILLALRKLEPRLQTPGVLFNVWLLFHAMGRILMELFRDDPRGEFILGLSLGTWFSILLGGWAIFNLMPIWRRRMAP